MIPRVEIMWFCSCPLDRLVKIRADAVCRRARYSQDTLYSGDQRLIMASTPSSSSCSLILTAVSASR